MGREHRAPRNKEVFVLARWQRLEPLAGVVFVILAVIALFTAAGEDFLAEPAEVADYYVDNSDRVIVAEIVGGLAIFAFFWFVGAVRNRLRVSETPEGGLPALAFGGGIAAATLLLVANAATMAGAFRAEEDGEIDPAVAAALNDISSLIIGIAAPVALAVFVAATGIVSIATAVLPRWLGWLSLLLALGFLIPYISFVFWVPVAVWVLAVSVLLYLRPGEAALRKTTATA
jgi:hypothetical protein